MKRYAEILRIPGVIAVVLSQLIARFPGGMLTLALLIHLQRQNGNFTVPGLVLAALSVGQAVASPITSRLMSRVGIRRVIGAVLAANAVAVAFVAVTVMTPIVAIVMGFVIGATLAPIQPAARVVYPTIVSRKQLQTLQALDASVQELIWIGGPVFTVLLATQVSAPAAVLAAGMFGTLGGIWFLSRPEVARVTLPPSTARMGAVLRKPAVLIGVITGLLVVGSFASIEAAVVRAFGSETDSPAGLILGLWAVASLIGGLAMGHTPIGPWALARRLSIIALGTTLSIFVIDDIVLLTFALLLGGVTVAPVMNVQYSIATESVEPGDAPESLGWLATGWVIGGALASAATGIAIDAYGTFGGFAMGAIFAVLAAIVPAVFVRFLPDLRHLAH